MLFPFVSETVLKIGFFDPKMTPKRFWKLAFHVFRAVGKKNEGFAVCELARPRFCCAVVMAVSARTQQYQHAVFRYDDLVLLGRCGRIAGLCNNANQLAHRANSTGVAGQESVDKMTALALEVYRLVGQQW